MAENNSTVKHGPRFIDISGRVFGSLEALSFHSKGKHGSLWECKCACGKIAIVRVDCLTTGNTQSCGCLHVGPVTHGHTRHGKTTTEYVSYARAKQRCTDPNHDRYSYYGARGIQFRFKSFEEFYAELGPKPSPSHTVDRIRNEGNYEKGNVKWSTKKEQANNRRKPSH